MVIMAMGNGGFMAFLKLKGFDAEVVNLMEEAHPYNIDGAVLIPA